MVIEGKDLWLHFYFLLNTHSHNGWHFRYGNLMTFKTSLVSYEMEVIGSGSIWKYKNERCAEASTWNLNDKLNRGRGQMLWFLGGVILHTRLAFACGEHEENQGRTDYLFHVLYRLIPVENRSSRCRSHSETRPLKPNCQESVHLWKSYLEKSFFIPNLWTTSSILRLDISILLPIVVLLRSDKVLAYAQKNNDNLNLITNPS